MTKMALRPYVHFPFLLLCVILVARSTLVVASEQAETYQQMQYPASRFERSLENNFTNITREHNPPTAKYDVIIGQASAFDYNAYIFHFYDIKDQAAKGVSTYLTGGNAIYGARNSAELKAATASQGCPTVPFCGTVALNSDTGSWQGNVQPGGTISTITPANTDTNQDYEIILITMGIRDWSQNGGQSISNSLSALQTGGGYFYTAFSNFLKLFSPNKTILIRMGYEMCATYVNGNECDAFGFTAKVKTPADMNNYVKEFDKFQRELHSVVGTNANLVLNPLGSVKNAEAFFDAFDSQHVTQPTHFGVDIVLDSDTRDARSPIDQVFAAAKSRYPNIINVVPESSVNVEAANSLDLLQYIRDKVVQNDVRYWTFINRNNLGGGANFNSRLQDNQTLATWWRQQFQ